MTEEFSSVTRVDQFLDVLDRALRKIVNNISSDLISDCYSGIDSDDKLFVEIAANKFLSEYKEKAKETIIQQCEEMGVFEFLRQLDDKDKELEEKKEIAEKYCGSVVDVNKLLASQRMHIKKQLLLSLENQILSDEKELHELYTANKDEMKKIQKGVHYLKSLHLCIVCLIN